MERKIHCGSETGNIWGGASYDFGKTKGVFPFILYIQPKPTHIKPNRDFISTTQPSLLENSICIYKIAANIRVLSNFDAPYTIYVKSCEFSGFIATSAEHIST